MKRSGSRVHEAGKTMYLYCNRSGTFVSHSKGRRIKKIGSSKISAHCTALIKYFEESSGCVKATVCSTHYGHDKDHRFLRLTKNQKEHIANRMKSGMSRELVLDSLHSTFVNKLDRIHELSKKDLNNIQLSYKIPRTTERRKSQSSVSNLPIDLISDDWFTEIDTIIDSPVLYYKDLGKEEGALLSKDKCLILMTKGQKDLFLKFCNNSVLYVTTLKLSSLISLFLTVVFVLDDFYETSPVCFMVSTNTRLDMMKILFDKILVTVGPIVLRALATDDNETVTKAWCDVMGPLKNFIIANRHVDSEWRRNLTTVEDEACQGEVYDKLYDFIENSEGTKDKMKELISELKSSVMTSSFAQYLEKNFLENIESWSTCYLKSSYDLREPIDFELSYSKISNLCDVCSKYNKRVNHCARGLIKLLLEFQSNRNRKVAESIVEITNAHELSLTCSVENVFPLRNGVWKVKSDCDSTQQMYEVKEALCNFDDCVLTCVHCETCVHTYYCACDNYFDGKTCVHVHLVGTMVKKCRNNFASNDININNEFHQLGTIADTLVKDEEIEPLQDTNPEVRSKKLETLKVLRDIGAILLAEKDEKRLDSLGSLIKDVQNNVNMLINYSDHAQKIVFSKTAKPVKKKTKSIAKKKVNSRLSKAEK